MAFTTQYKSITKTHSTTYINHRGFDFVKDIELTDNGVRFTISPVNSNEVIYYRLIVDEMFLDDLVIDLERELDIWIDENTGEFERLFVKLKAL
ncbi:hypothetical protein [Staphylococcus capitis]|uniref:hypothetical protein n=1 Tax=Staphylococcus capitis TaxID=29388 RepID=UPI00145A9E26|nr:hypothetical protein [Staphylococcus capitis]NMK92034.1 hypothetical protein [Staphylococcus capitis]